MPLFWKRAPKNTRTQKSGPATLPPMPVIVGSPRSGTTLLRLMLDSHPQLAIPPETGFLSLGQKLRGKGDKLRKKFFQTIINFPTSAPNWPDFEIPEESFWLTLMEIEPFTIAAGYRAFYRLYSERFGKTRWGDKTPLYCLELDKIRKVMPEARFIHIIRDGRDAALSLRRMHFSPGWAIETQAAFWRKCVLKARRAGLGHADYKEVRYEKLILDTRETLGAICTFIDLNYEEAMLSYYKRAPERLKEHKARSRPDGTALVDQETRIRQQQRTTEPPDPGCIFAWKTEMSIDERMRFKLVAGDLLTELGYDV